MPNPKLIDWETRAHDLELEVAEWKAHARRWERRAKENDPEQSECAEWKRKARESRDQCHTWRLLYQDLLEKIGHKLDLEGNNPNTQMNTKASTK